MGDYKVYISGLAKQDMHDIASYIKYDLQEPAISEKTVDAIADAVFTLENMPHGSAWLMMNGFR